MDANDDETTKRQPEPTAPGATAPTLADALAAVATGKRRLRNFLAGATRSGSGLASLLDSIDLDFDAVNESLARAAARPASDGWVSASEHERLRQAARWLGEHAPGTPVPDWVDAAVNARPAARPASEAGWLDAADLAPLRPRRRPRR